MKKLFRKMYYSIVEYLGIYDMCGCDACHYEIYNFHFFYLFKDWDAEVKEWKFGWRVKNK